MSKVGAPLAKKIWVMIVLKRNPALTMDQLKQKTQLEMPTLKRVLKEIQGDFGLKLESPRTAGQTSVSKYFVSSWGWVNIDYLLMRYPEATSPTSIQEQGFYPCFL